MVFDQYGRFMPNMQIAANVSGVPTASSASARPSVAKAAMQTTPFSGAFKAMPSSTMQAQPQGNGWGQEAPPQQAAPQPQPAPQPAPQPMAPQQPAQFQMYARRPGPQLGAPPPPQPGPTVTQQAGRGNAQGVQNYMQALNQVGAGSNNAQMNYQGQMGAGPQAGFRGFGYNPGYGPSFVNQGYTGPMQAQLGFQQNMASANRNYNSYNQARQGSVGYGPTPMAYTSGVQAGGTGGVAGQPQWQTPKPWGQPANMPRDTEQWEKYFFGEYSPDVDPNMPTQMGSFYSPHFAGAGGYDDVVSDERAKENISYAQNDLEDFMNALGAYSYEYKDKSHGEGRFISPMAQEFEKSKLGKDAVVETPSGLKMVNYGRIAGVQTAALALLNQKYNDLEKRFNDAMKTRLSKRGK